MNSRTLKLWHSARVDAGRDISSDCADFYLLERLASDRFNMAERLMYNLESRLSEEYSSYLNLAIGGESRHILEERRVQPEEPLREFLEAVRPAYKSEVDSRLVAWETWFKMTRSPAVRRRMIVASGHAFENEEWGQHNAGGKPWATACRVLVDFYDGKIKARTFVDRCFTLEHNNACIFDKAYEVEKLGKVLTLQAENRYTELSRYADRNIRRLWNSWEAEHFSAYDPAWFGRETS